MSASVLRTAVEIRNPRGLHLRFAADFMQKARAFACTVVVEKDGQRVDGKSLWDLILLGAAPGCEVTIEVEGVDAVDALPDLVRQMNSIEVYESESEPGPAGSPSV